MTQTRNGKAYEYALANHFSQIAGVSITPSKALDVAKEKYAEINGSPLQTRLNHSAENIVQFLMSQEERFKDAQHVTLQDDNAGRKGDTRDIIIQCGKDKVGISAKHNHDAIKHSRLSSSIDFGKKWGGHPVSQNYWDGVNPIFDTLRKAKQEGKMFREIENKAATCYLPILTAFEDELDRLCHEHSSRFIEPFFQYLIGQYDCYRAICHKDQSVVESINMKGTLRWGKKWQLPTRIEKIGRRRGISSTLLVSFEGGWQISFRLHSASSRVEPSLKFDIKFIGVSSSKGQHTIKHNMVD